MPDHSKIPMDNAPIKVMLALSIFTLILFLIIAIIVMILGAFIWMACQLIGYPYSFANIGEIEWKILLVLFFVTVIGRWIIRAYRELYSIFSGEKYRFETKSASNFGEHALVKISCTSQFILPILRKLYAEHWKSPACKISKNRTF